MCCRLLGNSVNTFLTWGVGIETDFLGAFDVYGIPIPHARKFFAKLFSKKRKSRPTYSHNTN